MAHGNGGDSIFEKVEAVEANEQEDTSRELLLVAGNTSDKSMDVRHAAISGLIRLLSQGVLPIDKDEFIEDIDQAIDQLPDGDRGKPHYLVELNALLDKDKLN